MLRQDIIRCTRKIPEETSFLVKQCERLRAIIAQWLVPTWWEASKENIGDIGVVHRLARLVSSV